MLRSTTCIPSTTTASPWCSTDPDYYVDLNRSANTPAVYHTWQYKGRDVVAAVWDPNDEPVTAPDAYWNAPLQRKLVRIDDGESQEIDGLPKSAVFSTSDYRLDDELYMFVSDEAEQNAHSSLYRVTDSGVEKTVSTVGDIGSIGRVR